MRRPGSPGRTTHDWPGKFAPIPWVFAKIVRHLHRSSASPLVHDVRTERAARRTLTRAGVDLGRVDLVPCPTDRGWMRDSAGIFVTNGEGGVGLLDWGFNAWAKYDNWELDDRTPAAIAAHLNVPTWRPEQAGRRVVLEGGAIDVNGAGLLLTTEECLVSDVQAAQPRLTRTTIERVWPRYLGIRKVLWLGRGIVGDDTHGHVDDLARFVGPRTVAVVVEDDPADVNYEPLQENLRTAAGDDRRRRPAAGSRSAADAGAADVSRSRLPASYANFYIANDRVLVPTFNDANDRRALSILADLFPGRSVVGIHAVDLVWGFGTLHCLTQQEPTS